MQTVHRFGDVRVGSHYYLDGLNHVGFFMHADTFFGTFGIIYWWKIRCGTPDCSAKKINPSRCLDTLYGRENRWKGGPPLWAQISRLSWFFLLRHPSKGCWRSLASMAFVKRVHTSTFASVAVGKRRLLILYMKYYTETVGNLYILLFQNTFSEHVASQHKPNGKSERVRFRDGLIDVKTRVIHYNERT